MGQCGVTPACAAPASAHLPLGLGARGQCWSPGEVAWDPELWPQEMPTSASGGFKEDLPLGS